jgi:hypothetical protein
MMVRVTGPTLCKVTQTAAAKASAPTTSSNVLPTGKPRDCQGGARVARQGALTRVWARRGSRPRAVRDTRYQWACIFGAACPARGVAAGLVMPFADTEAMNAHLAEIARTVDPRRPCHPHISACLRGNKLAITVFDSHDAVVAKCCEAWNFFASDPHAVACITFRHWAVVSD